MVSLPKVPLRLVTAEEPRSGLSGRDIAAPYATLAGAMQEGAQALESIAERGAEEAAARAVTIGEDGQVKVEQSPIPMVGKAGRIYERAVKVGAVAAYDSSADNRLNELRAETRDDPSAFRTAAETYRDEKVAELTTSTNSAAAGQALRRQMDNRINQIHGSLLNQHQTIALKRADESITSRITTLGNEMETLARRNGITNEDGTPSAEFQTRLDNVKTLLQERVSNPLLAYPQEKADAYLDTLMTRVQGAAIHEQMERVYRERGADAARTYLRDSVRGLEGRVKEADKIERSGLAWLRTEEAGFRAERDAISREWSAAKGQASSLPRESLIDLENRAAAIGNARVAMDVATTRAALDINAEIRALPVEEQARIARSGTVNLVDRIVRVESGGNAAARSATSSATGAGQFISSTWLDIVKRNRPDIAQGKTDAEILALRTNPELSREMVANYARENGEKLAAAGAPTNDGALYLAHFLGPGDAIKVLKADPNAPLTGLVNPASITANHGIFSRNPTAGQLVQWATGKVGGGTSDLTTSRTGLTALGLLKKDLARDLGPKLDALGDRVRRGEIPRAQDINDLGALVSVVGTPQQKRQAAELMAQAEIGAEFQSLSAPQRDAAISAMETRLRNSDSQVESDLVASLRAQDQAINKAYRSDPYDAFYRYGRGDAVQATPPVDFGNPQQAAAVVTIRARQQAVIREQEGIGPFSVLRPAEAEQFRGVMAQGDARQVANMMTMLSALPEDMLAATVANPAVKSGITAAIHTTDSEKMNAVMSNLDVWYRRDPQAFSARFGPEAWNALKTWQSNLRYMTPEDFAKAQTKALDPGAQEVRKKNTQAGEELARKMKPDDVIGALTPFFSSQLFGLNAPTVPTDPQVRDLLMGDFTNVYGRRYADTLDKDQALTQAAEAIGMKWQRSALNQNEVMLRPPESVYPMVNGEHRYLAPQIESAIAERLGVPARQTVPSLAPGAQGVTMAGPRNFDYRIVSDATTEQEAQRYDRRLPAGDTNKPPSYQVIVRDNRRQNPRWEPMAGRFAFDPNTAVNTGREQFEAGRALSRQRSEAFEQQMRDTGNVLYGGI